MLALISWLRDSGPSGHGILDLGSTGLHSVPPAFMGLSLYQLQSGHIIGVTAPAFDTKAACSLDSDDNRLEFEPPSAKLRSKLRFERECHSSMSNQTGRLGLPKENQTALKIYRPKVDLR